LEGRTKLITPWVRQDEKSSGKRTKQRGGRKKPQIGAKVSVYKKSEMTERGGKSRDTPRGRKEKMHPSGKTNRVKTRH